MEWDGSIETLSEHEADATGEGEWGCVPHLGSPASLTDQFSLLMRKNSLPNTSWYALVIGQGTFWCREANSKHCLKIITVYNSQD